MIKKKTSASGAEALFVAAFTYALTGILVREVSPMWSDSGQVLARFLLVLVILTAFSLFSKKKLTLPRNKLHLTLSLGAAFALMVFFFTVAIGKTTVANVLFVFYAVNMISAFVLGTIILKEKVSRNKIIALGFAFIGLAVYSDAVIGGNLGIIFSLFAGICGGITVLVSKQLKGVNRNTSLIGQYIVATAAAGVMVLFSSEKIVRTVSLHDAILTVVFSLVIILGSYLTLYGFQHFDVNIGTVIMSTELVFAAVMAYFLYDEVPKLHELIGGIFIFTGSVIASGVFDKQKDKAASKQIAQPD